MGPMVHKLQSNVRMHRTPMVPYDFDDELQRYPVRIMDNRLFPLVIIVPTLFALVTTRHLLLLLPPDLVVKCLVLHLVVIVPVVDLLVPLNDLHPLPFLLETLYCNKPPKDPPPPYEYVYWFICVTSLHIPT